MKKLLPLILIVLLSGCLAGAPVQQAWPDIPEELTKACPDLKEVASTHKLSDVLEVVADNYSTYYECKTKVDDWITWYNGQKKIYEGK
jgi:hypothetical protein